MQPWTYTSEFSQMNVDFLCRSMCVKFNYLTMDFPLPLPKSIIGHVFLYACLCDLLSNGGSLTIVDVHGWCVSTVIQQFFWLCPWMKVLTNAFTHTHTHTHTDTYPTINIQKLKMSIGKPQGQYYRLPYNILRTFNTEGQQIKCVQSNKNLY